jgi:hypothetical protein
MINSAEFETGEGLRSIDRKRPLTQAIMKLLPVMPSPTRGEGATTKVRKETRALGDET